MKLIYILPSEIPSRQANTIQVMRMCEAFASQGHEVKLLCPNNSADRSDNVFSYYGVKENFSIQWLPWRPLNGYQFTIAAALTARLNKADLVYGRSIAGCYFSTLLGLDVVYESHVPADDIHPITDKLFPLLLRSSNLRGLVVITNALKEYYNTHYNLQKAIHVVPDAASFHNGEPIAEISRNKKQQVGYVGHLYRGKGVGLITDLAQEVAEASFHIVGGTETDIQRWQERTKTIPNIIFHGHVSPARVEDYLTSFDVVLAPYQREVEGTGGDTNLSQWMSPLKLFEYMAAGKPIVCSDLPVLREVLTDGENALLCSPDNVKEWAESLRELQTNQRLREDLASNARADFEEHYSYKARATKLLEIFTQD